MAACPPPDYDSPPSYKQVTNPEIHIELNTILESDLDYVPTQRDSGNESMGSSHTDTKKTPPPIHHRKEAVVQNSLLLPPNIKESSKSGNNSRNSSRVPSRVPTPDPSRATTPILNGTTISSPKRGSTPIPSHIGTPIPSQSPSRRGSVKVDRHQTELPQDDSVEDNNRPLPMWNIFKKTPVQKVSWNMERVFNRCLMCAKLFAYMFLFFGTLITAMASKTSLLVLTSHLGSMVKSQQTEFDGLVYLLLLGLCIPHGLSFLLSAAKSWFGNDAAPSRPILLFVACQETFHAAGQTFFVMYILPRLAPTKAVALLLSVGLIPSIIRTVTLRSPSSRWKFVKTILDIISTLLFLTVILCIFYEEIIYLNISEPTGKRIFGRFANNTSVFIVSSRAVGSEPVVTFLLLMSLLSLGIRWWEAMACEDIRFCSWIIPLRKFAITLHSTRARTHLLVSLWKIAVTVLVTFAIFGRFGDLINVFGNWYSNMKVAFVLYPNATTVLRSSDIGISELNQHLSGTSSIGQDADLISMLSASDWILVSPFLIYIFSSWILYHFATVSCKLHMQLVCFNIPILLTTPLLLVLFTVVCSVFLEEKTRWQQWIVWECLEENGEASWRTIVVALSLWFPASLWITRHLWTPDNERLAFTDRIFVIPVFDAVLLHQSYLYGRRKDDHFDRKRTGHDDNVSINTSSSGVEVPNTEGTNTLTMIYICATMWHENVNEMVKMLKSVFRLDQDQSKRRLFRDLVNDHKDPDYYEFEAHIFFDDSMDVDELDFSHPNGFVQQLVDVIPTAANEVHLKLVPLEDPTKMVTPYGGRLEWQLPGGNKIVAHLKDKSKIRHRKRWSQVMYMYYLLGYRMFLNVNSETIGLSRGTYESVLDQLPQDLRSKAENTYLLALDGDVDFKPEAVRLLVDMMKKNKQVGAACGRIKPIGSGPVMWYQKFEYAIGHWLQKATEHMYGCVLCSPGCFSLFRGSAIMDNNVMRTYATKPTTARHYLQYDQGEDRWLCTLLLQRGYKIEYCAAADALTYVPETFQEFFNQRRRWGPSTTANIMDLLGSFRETVRVNPNISYLYMLYQFVLLASSLLGPATVLLMVQTSLSAVFYSLPAWATYTSTFGPTIIFVIVCFKCKSNTQLLVAAIFSSVYGLVMMAVIAGTIVNVIQDGWYTPSAIFLYIVIGVFAIAGILHPTEIFDLLCGVLYFLCVPSTFIYLMIYSICNLNIVSWGTREVKKPVASDNTLKQQIRTKTGDQDVDPISQAMEELRSQQQTGPSGFLNKFSIFNRQNRANSLLTLAFLHSLKEMRSNAQSSHGQFRPRQRQRTSSVGSTDRRSQVATAENIENDDDLSEEESVNHDWIQNSDLGNGAEQLMDDKEREFFESLISEYLFPLSNDKEEQEKISADLIELRNNVSFAFFMLNGLWLVIMIALQEVKAYVSIVIKIDESNSIKLEPLGFLFLVTFAIILVLQFVAMLMHRYGTFTHILSTTKLFHIRKIKTDEQRRKETLKQIHQLQQDWFSPPETQDQGRPVPDGDVVVNMDHDIAPDYGDEADQTANPPPDYQASWVERVPVFPGHGRMTLRGNFGHNFFNDPYSHHNNNRTFEPMSLSVLQDRLEQSLNQQQQIQNSYSARRRNQYRY